MYNFVTKNKIDFLNGLTKEEWGCFAHVNYMSYNNLYKMKPVRHMIECCPDFDVRTKDHRIGLQIVVKQIELQFFLKDKTYPLVVWFSVLDENFVNFIKLRIKFFKLIPVWI